MATDTDRKFLGRDGTERLVATIKTLLSGKQDKDSFVMTDRTTGVKYCLYVDNGKLMMSEQDETISAVVGKGVAGRSVVGSDI